jgi:hypothetical protein
MHESGVSPLPTEEVKRHAHTYPLTLTLRPTKDIKPWWNWGTGRTLYLYETDNNYTNNKEKIIEVEVEVEVEGTMKGRNEK